MHYYQFNIADYRKDTQHLTPMEHYIYRELMDWYYLDEQQIPKETQSVLRRLRLVSENNQDLLNVLEEFFTEAEEGYRHTRIEKEIDAYKRRAETARANGSKGGRPKKPKKTQPVNLANPEKTGSKANHKPITNNQEPLTKEDNTSRENPAGISTRNGVPFQKIIDKWNGFATEQGLPQVVKRTTSLEGQLRQRWQDDIKSLEEWDNYFHYLAQSKFLTGRVPPSNGRTKPFRASLSWVTNLTNYSKIAAGEYHS